MAREAAESPPTPIPFRSAACRHVPGLLAPCLFPRRRATCLRRRVRRSGMEGNAGGPHRSGTLAVRRHQGGRDDAVLRGDLVDDEPNLGDLAGAVYDDAVGRSVACEGVDTKGHPDRGIAIAGVCDPAAEVQGRRRRALRRRSALRLATGRTSTSGRACSTRSRTGVGPRRSSPQARWARQHLYRLQRRRRHRQRQGHRAPHV